MSRIGVISLTCVSIRSRTFALAETIAGIAEAIAAAPPLAMALTKQAVDLGSETDLNNGIRVEMAAIERCLADGGWRDGLNRFAKSVGGKENHDG